MEPWNYTDYCDYRDYRSLAEWRGQHCELYARIRQSNDPQSAWQDWCETRQRLFREHPMSPVAESKAPAPKVFKYDPGLRFSVAVKALPIRKTNFGEMPLLVIGQTVGLRTKLGQELNVYWTDEYSGGLFLPFRDATNGTETYGGGRYLLDGAKGADLGENREGRRVLDFNFAYHPSCAHNPKWACPLAPSENTLTAAVRAGEVLGP